jgi:hypothetical protein
MAKVRMYMRPTGSMRKIKKLNRRWDRQRPSSRGAGPTDDHGGSDIAIPATGATAGIPGTWTPPGSTPRSSPATMSGIVASPATAWTSGQYVQTLTEGAAGRTTWTGTGWVGGVAP